MCYLSIGIAIQTRQWLSGLFIRQVLRCHDRPLVCNAQQGHSKTKLSSDCIIELELAPKWIDADAQANEKVKGKKRE